LGVTTYDILVFQDFFVELDLPAAIGQGETVAVNITLYNYLPEAQAIQLDPVPADWYSLVAPPQSVTLPPNGAATVTFTIRAEQAGDFSLQVVATGEHTSDAVATGVTVE
jgi:CD109 antigen